jgi:hypothetical protein
MSGAGKWVAEDAIWEIDAVDGDRARDWQSWFVINEKNDSPIGFNRVCGVGNGWTQRELAAEHAPLIAAAPLLLKAAIMAKELLEDNRRLFVESEAVPRADGSPRYETLSPQAQQELALMDMKLEFVSQAIATAKGGL